MGARTPRGYCDNWDITKEVGWAAVRTSESTMRTDSRKVASRLSAGKAPLAAVVATDPTSGDADCDNGATVHGTRRSQRVCERATRHIGGAIESSVSTTATRGVSHV